uniref:NADH dehydrogenase [ubiquinone] 1 subunit C2 n=1 Tax=Eptatretus burgeri TaxID=7764 RepID=A0A8C4Q9B2_EPTBU
MVWLSNEARDLHPPNLLNFNSLWLGVVFWGAVVVQNVVVRRPAFKSGIHKQLLLFTAGYVSGYHLSKREDFINATLARDAKEYVGRHPEDFPQPMSRTFAEHLEGYKRIR